MSKHLWKTGTAVVAILSAAGIVAGCGNNAPQNNQGQGNTGAARTTTAQPREGGSILLDSIANFKDLDPAISYDMASFELVNAMYDPLLTYDKATNNIVGRLAQGYKVSPDGKTYTFQIRKGVKFWNGDAVTAQTFVDSFKRVLDKSTNSPGESFIDPIVVGSTAYHNGTTKSLPGVVATGKYTLVIKLTTPQAFFPQIIAMPFFSAVDPAWVKKVGNTAFDTTKPMGTGPFKLQKYDASTEAVLVKNPDYWQKDNAGNRLPYLNKVTIQVNANEQLEGEDFQSGKTAMLATMAQIPSSQYMHFLTTPSLKSTIVSAPENDVFYLGMNNKMKPFNNKLVRQAINYAIDKNRLKQLINGRATIANQPLPPGVVGHVANMPADATYTYNIAKAKALLKQAGYPNGFTTQLYVYNNPTRIKLCTSIQNDLSKIGIKVQIRTSSWNTWLAQNEAGNVQPLFFSAWNQDFPDASDFLNTLLNSDQPPANNSTNYKNVKVDAWLNAAQTEPNQAKRNVLYRNATIQIMKDAPWAPLYWGQFSYAIQPWVHGYFLNQTLPDPLQFIWIDSGHDQG